ncbi:MAG: hypothetical protein OXB88_02325 [Bacteriovoracales bacterium]|nr:hypothetical protein [Bacteriovoracales bacterium]
MGKLIKLSLLMLFTMIFVLSCDDDSDKSSGVSVSIQGGESPSFKNTAQFRFQPTTTSASSLKLKVYRIGFSTNGDCSNPHVFDLDGSYLDFVGNPNLGQGQIPPSNYKCVIIEMSDSIKFTPSSDVGYCDSTVEYTADVCITDASIASSLPNYTLLDGSDGGACSPDDGTEDRVVMHISVDALTADQITSQTTADNVMLLYEYPPRSPNPRQISSGGQTFDLYSGFHLSNSFDAMSDSTGIFYIDVTNQISSDEINNGCTIIDIPTFGFYRE